MPGCEEVADCEASGPLGSASEITVAAKLVRLLFSPVSNPDWVDKSVCWFCQAVNGPVSRLRIAFTTDLTSMPFPFSRAAALKLIPIVFPFSLHDRGRSLVRRWSFSSRGNLLQQFLGLVDAAELLGAGHLQDQRPRLLV